MIHGIDSAVFGDEAIDRIVKGMRTIHDGKDAIDLCGSIIRHYADEIADLVGEVRIMDAVKQSIKNGAMEI